LVSLSLYTDQGCNIISGDLYIIDLPLEVTDAGLHQALRSVRSIQGHLYVMNNEYITSMSFFEKLERVNGITYLDNPNLIDAHLNSLVDLNTLTRVEGCERLCPARYTGQRDSGADESTCANPRMRFYLVVTGTATRGELSIIGDMVSRALNNLTAGWVWMLYSILLCLTEFACSGMGM
jgi:hypothetical protein